MDTRSRVLGSLVVPFSLLAACISSAGIGVPPGGGDDAGAGIGGSAVTTGGASSGPVVSTGGATSITSPAGGSTTTTLTGGAPTVATGGSPVVGAGGSVTAATGGMPSIGTSASCDFTNAACTNPCSTLVQWQQVDCATYLTCMQSNSTCVKASDPTCAHADPYGNPICTAIYSLSDAAAALGTYMKCVCGLT